MKKIKTEHEKRLVQAVAFSVSIVAILMGIVYSIFLFKPDFLSNSNAFFVILGIIVLHIILFFFKGDMILRWIFKLRIVKRSQMAGRWNIRIEYIDNDAKKAERNGTLQIEDSYMGLYLKGNSLFDSVSQSLEVQNWESSYADVFIYDKQKILFYQYITYEDGDPNNPTKTGIVNLKKKSKEDIFSGDFKDFEVDTGKEIRSGKVSIYRTK